MARRALKTWLGSFSGNPNQGGRMELRWPIDDTMRPLARRCVLAFIIRNHPFGASTRVIEGIAAISIRATKTSYRS